jgi:hypothetical protein
MDKDFLAYLADLATVRNHINSILNVGRGVVDQKTLHQVSSRAGSLDQLFVRTLLSGQLPGRTTPSVVQNNDDYVNISQRLREEKAKLTEPTPAPPAKTPAQIALENDEEDDDIPTNGEIASGFGGDDMAAVAALIEKAEKQVQKKRSKKKTS